MLQSLRRAYCLVSSCITVAPPSFPAKMSETRTFRRARYDGRSKKRQWEERRSDKGAGLDCPQKKTKVENDGTKSNAEEGKELSDRIKRRKFVLLISYSGTGYYGMQRNPQLKTIEEDIIKALHKSNFIDDESYNTVQNMQFQRAARTDKGVSAARQVVSLKMKENFDAEIVNKELPDVIRIHGCKRVTKGFNSKSQCDSRTYIYILPTVAFANKDESIPQKEFRLEEGKFNKINELLQIYIGTKNYHNFTARKKPNDPSNMRYMKSFIMEKPFIRKDVEFAVLKVHGQSFMMHQIRKMVGLLIALIRGQAPLDITEKMFSLEKVSIPRAPGLGLVLDYVHYDRYNDRYGNDGMHEKLIWDEVDKDVNEFKEKYIFSRIVNEEVENERIIEWLKTRLDKHNYNEDVSEDAKDEYTEEEIKEGEENGPMKSPQQGNEEIEVTDKNSENASKIESKQTC